MFAYHCPLSRRWARAAPCPCCSIQLLRQWPLTFASADCAPHPDRAHCDMPQRQWLRREPPSRANTHGLHPPSYSPFYEDHAPPPAIAHRRTISPRRPRTASCSLTADCSQHPGPASVTTHSASPQHRQLRTAPCPSASNRAQHPCYALAVTQLPAWLATPRTCSSSRPPPRSRPSPWTSWASTRLAPSS